VLAAAVQLNSMEDRDRNLAVAERLVRTAAAAGAQLVVLPEKFNRLCEQERMAALAEPLDGPTVSWASALAAELELDLVAGSFVERAADGRCFNTSVHVDPAGEPRAVYRKLHLFDVEVAGTVYRESATESPGEEIVCSRLAGGEGLGLSVCYDLRFPELYRILTVRGAQVLCVPAAFTLATTRDHWELLLRARAVENQCYVVAANQIGTHPPGNRSGGRSMIVDPWGLVLAQAPDGEDLAVAELDFARLEEVRAKLPALEHRREDAYVWPVHAEAGR
jgi:predicted amidohydrolase